MIPSRSLETVQRKFSATAKRIICVTVIGRPINGRVRVFGEPVIRNPRPLDFDFLYDRPLELSLQACIQLWLRSFSYLARQIRYPSLVSILHILGPVLSLPIPQGASSDQIHAMPGSSCLLLGFVATGRSILLRTERRPQARFNVSSLIELIDLYRTISRCP